MRSISLRRLFTYTLCIVATQLSAAASLPAQKYLIDNDHTSIVFAISHFGLSYTYGRFNQCSGSFELQEGQPGEAGFAFKIDAKSIDTNNDERDQHLRSPEFFDTDQFPEISFQTIGIKKVDDLYEVTGELKIRDQVRVVIMPMRLVAVGKGPKGKMRAGFFAKFTLKRSEFGMDKMLGAIGDNVAVTFSFEGIAESPDEDSDVDTLDE